MKILNELAGMLEDINRLSHTGRNAPVVACELENEVSNARGFSARK